MYALIFDKETSNEKRIMLSSFHERPISNTFSGSLNMSVNKSSDIPDIKPFIKNAEFNTVEAVNSDGINLPINGSYNYVVDVSCNYDDDTKRFGISLVLSWQEKEGIE